MSGSFVGRVAGVPSPDQDLGTAALPWGTARFNSLIVNGSAVDTSQIAVPQNRVISGKTRSTSNQPAYIVPNGAALSFVLDGTPTSFAYDVNGTSYQVSTDITKGSLTAAPSSQNTALINDTTAAAQEDTRLWGEADHGKSIIIDTAGTNVTAAVGSFAAFKLVGSGTEYLLAFVKSATELVNCKRGYFYDSSLNPINRTTFSNNDTLTLMKLGWIFLDQDATTIDVTYTNPKWSFTSPASPATGDYWYDLANQLWKRYDGASFQIINRTFIGNFINDTTACIGARCVDFFGAYSSENSVNLEKSTSEIVKGRTIGQKVNVGGTDFKFENSVPSWNITTDLAPSTDMYNATEQASTLYYLYLSDDGEEIISDISPYYRADLDGRYHPHNPWRLVGLMYNDGSSDISTVMSEGFPEKMIQLDNVVFDNFGTTTNDIVGSFDGEHFIIEGSFVSGTATAGQAALTLPFGWTANFSKYTGTVHKSVGEGTALPTGASASVYALFYGIVFYLDMSDNTKIFMATKSGTTAGVFDALNSSNILVSGNSMTFKVRVPLNQFNR